MKNFILLLILSTILISSCSEEVMKDEIGYSKENLIYSIGEIHNSCLENCYSNLSYYKDNSSSFGSVSMTIDSINKIVTDYLISKNIPNVNLISINNLINNSGYFFLTSEFKSKEIEDRIDLLLSSSLLSSVLSQKLFAVFNSISVAEDRNDLVTKLNMINDLNLNLNDKEILIMCKNVALSSWTHWITNNNMELWVDLNYFYNNDVIGIRIDPKRKEVVKADIEGVVEGALGGAGIAGVGALAGAMIYSPLKSAWAAWWCCG